MGETEEERKGKEKRERGGKGEGKRGRGKERKERSEEHTSELQSRPHISYAVFCLKKKNFT